MDTPYTPDPTADSPRPPTPLADAVRHRSLQLTGPRALCDVDEEGRRLMAAELLAFARGWIGAALDGSGVLMVDVADALDLIATVLTPPPVE